jgi:hypothetical protein
MLTRPQQIEDRQWAGLVPPARATALVALSPRFLARSASPTWIRSVKSSRKWKAWTSRGSDRAPAVRMAPRSSEDPCALLKMDTADRDRWDLRVARLSHIPRRTTPTSGVDLLRDPATALQRKGLGLRLEA